LIDNGNIRKRKKEKEEIKIKRWQAWLIFKLSWAIERFEKR